MSIVVPSLVLWFLLLTVNGELVESGTGILLIVSVRGIPAVHSVSEIT